jgi:hypothetical protein
MCPSMMALIVYWNDWTVSTGTVFAQMMVASFVPNGAMLNAGVSAVANVIAGVWKSCSRPATH